MGREQSKRRPIQAATPLVFQGGTVRRSEGPRTAGRELSVVLDDVNVWIFKVKSSPPTFH